MGSRKALSCTQSNPKHQADILVTILIVLIYSIFTNNAYTGSAMLNLSSYSAHISNAATNTGLPENTFLHPVKGGCHCMYVHDKYMDILCTKRDLSVPV